MHFSHRLNFVPAGIADLQIEHTHSFGVRTIEPSFSSMFTSQPVPILSAFLNSTGRTILPSSSTFLTIILILLYYNIFFCQITTLFSHLLLTGTIILNIQAQSITSFDSFFLYHFYYSNLFIIKKNRRSYTSSLLSASLGYGKLYYFC